MSKNFKRLSSTSIEGETESLQSGEDGAVIKLGWLTGLVVPGLVLLLASSLFEAKPQPKCDGYFDSAVLACIRDLNQNPKSHIDSDEMIEIQLTDFQYLLVQSGVSLDRVGLSAGQQDRLRLACERQGYRYVKLILGLEKCR